MIKSKLLFILVAIFFTPVYIYSAVYYVDAVNGNDSNTGLTTLTAWKTISKVNSAVYLPGDYILFKRGQKWRGQIDFPSSGTPLLPITLGAYDAGTKPIISGANLLTGFTQHSGNVWKKVVTLPQQVFFNELRGVKQSLLANVNADKEWFFETATGTLYLYSIGNPSVTYNNPGIEVTARLYALNITQDNIRIENLQLEKTSNSALKITSFAENIVADSIIFYQWSAQPNWEGDGDGIPTIAGADIYGNNCTIKNSTFGKNTGNDVEDQNWAGFVSIYINARDTKISHNSIYHNCIENESNLGNKAYGILVWVTGGTLEIDNNFIYHTGGHGISIRSDTKFGDTIRVFNNVMQYTGQAGLSSYMTRRSDGPGKGGVGYVFGNDVSFADRLGGDVGGNGTLSAGLHFNNGKLSYQNPDKPYMKYYVYDNVSHHNQAKLKPNASDSDGIGVDYNANEVEVFRNLLYNNWGKGVYIWNASRAKIYYNIIYGNDAGTTVTSASRTTERADSNEIFNNTYYKNWNTDAYGPNYHCEIYFGGNGKWNTIKNNILYGHENGVIYTFRDVNTIGCVTDNNLLFKDSGNFAYITEVPAYISYEQWRTNYPQWDNNSIYANPQLKNPAAGQFDLNVGSPAINKGAVLGFTSDFYKNPIQGLPDIGAIEFQDIIPPAVKGVTVVNSNSIKVLFSEKVSSAEAQAKANYIINKGVVVNSSVLNVDQLEATLSTSTHPANQEFLLTITNVKDLAGNVISAPGNTYSYTYQINPGTGNVILIAAMSGKLSGDARLGSMTGMKNSRAVYFQGLSGGATYNIDIPKAGKWYAWARMYYMSSGGKNSFFIGMNGTQNILGDDDTKYNVWHWDGYKSKRVELGNLNTGANVLKLSGREPGLTLWVDQIVITDDSNYVGTDVVPQFSAIVINANAGTLSGDAGLGSMSGMKNTRAVYFKGTNGGAAYSVNIPKTGTWYVWARMYYMSSGGKNSFFFNIKNTQYILGDDNNKYNQWHWDGHLGVAINVGTLNAGNNTFSISGREPGLTLWVDQIVITDNPAYSPSLSLGKEFEEITEEAEQAPLQYELSQNYPNPFNPSTIIKYSVAEENFVKIQLYDVIGREVALLVDEMKKPGRYEVRLNGNSLAAGVYYYSITSGNFRQVKKMILLK